METLTKRIQYRHREGDRDYTEISMKSYPAQIFNYCQLSAQLNSTEYDTGQTLNHSLPLPVKTSRSAPVQTGSASYSSISEKVVLESNRVSASASELVSVTDRHGLWQFGKGGDASQLYTEAGSYSASLGNSLCLVCLSLARSLVSTVRFDCTNEMIARQTAIITSQVP